MKLLIALAVLMVPGAAFAQGFSNPQDTMGMPNSSTMQSSTEGRDIFRPLESPRVKEEKLARALALREEALVLEARDGGRLSADSKTYLRRKARAILNYRG